MEFLLLFYGLGPCLLYKFLKYEFWQNYCKLVKALTILMQQEISQEDMALAEQLIIQFSEEFEKLYVERNPTRIHMVRPCIHAIIHLVLETLRFGPGSLYSQWAMERTIGNLGEEIKQHANAYANLAQRALQRCQVNALTAIVPSLDIVDNRSKGLSKNSVDAGSGYHLIPAYKSAKVLSSRDEIEALRAYAEKQGAVISYEDAAKFPLQKWSRLTLPNKQTARSKWKEDVRKGPTRRARNVLVHIVSTRLIISMTI